MRCCSYGSYYPSHRLRSQSQRLSRRLKRRAYRSSLNRKAKVLDFVKSGGPDLTKSRTDADSDVTPSLQDFTLSSASSKDRNRFSFVFLEDASEVVESERRH